MAGSSSGTGGLGLGLLAGPAYAAGALVLALAAHAARRLGGGAAGGGAGARRARRQGAARPGPSGTARSAREADFDVPGVGSKPVNQPRPATELIWFPEPGFEPDAVPDNVKPKAPRPPAPAQNPLYAVWTAKKKEVPELLTAWAASAENDAQRAALQSLAALELPKEWAVWALADARTTKSEAGGFFLTPPREPQVIVMVDPVDAKTVNIQHVAANPREVGPPVCAVLQDWLNSLKPKQAVIRQPEELIAMGLQVQGAAEGGGARLSKGL